MTEAILTSQTEGTSWLLALLAVALFALIVSGIAVWLFSRLIRREKQLAAYKQCNFDAEGYSVPDAQVDTTKPERVQVGDSFIFVGMLDVPRLQRFAVDYVSFLLRFRRYAEALAIAAEGKSSDEDLAEFRRMLIDKKAYGFIGDIIDNAILSNAKANPNKLTKRHVLKVMEPDQLQRILFALWSFNYGLQFKKKIEAQIQAVVAHMRWDLLERMS